MPKKKEKVIMITDSLEPNSVYDSNRDTSCGNSVRSILMTKDNLKNLKNLWLWIKNIIYIYRFLKN